MSSILWAGVTDPREPGVSESFSELPEVQPGNEWPKIQILGNCRSKAILLSHSKPPTISSLFLDVHNPDWNPEWTLTQGRVSRHWNRCESVLKVNLSPFPYLLFLTMWLLGSVVSHSCLPCVYVVKTSQTSFFPNTPPSWPAVWPSPYSL